MTYAEQEAKMKRLFDSLWTPIEKEMPNTSESLYVKCRSNGHEWVDIATYDERMGWLDEEGYRYNYDDKIVAWMWYITPREI